MSLKEVLFDKLPSFRDDEDRDMRLVDVLPNDYLYCWHIRSSSLSEVDSVLTMIHPRHVYPDTLKQLNVWDKLQESTRLLINQKFTRLVKNNVNNENGENSGLSVHKEHKRSRNIDLPREIICTKCGDPQYIPPSVLTLKIGLEGIEGEERQSKIDAWINGFKCSKCNPKRKGRVRNPLFANIPKSVHCKCGKECTINAKNVYELTGGDVDKIKAYADNYLCRKCNPNWGSWLRGKKKTSDVENVEDVSGVEIVKRVGHRGRKANPENANFPKKATCIVCGDEVGIVPKQIREKAAKMGITVEELLGNYKCRSCGGRIKSNKE